MIKGIIFDCDGVILDSEPLFMKAAADQMDSYGVVFDQEKIGDCTGITAESFCEKCLKAYPEISCSMEDMLQDFFLYSNRLLMSDELQPMPGFVSFAKRMNEKGIRLAVASSSPADYILHKLNLFKVRPYFDVIVSADDITHSKPDPEIYLKAIHRLGIEKEELIAIEDAPNGIKAAKAAGLYTIGFKGSEIIQDTSLADMEVYSYSEIETGKESL